MYRKKKKIEYEDFPRGWDPLTLSWLAEITEL